MDGRGSFVDNIFTERLWRGVKYEEVYSADYETLPEARQGLRSYLRLYNQERTHQSLVNVTPATAHAEPKRLTRIKDIKET